MRNGLLASDLFRFTPLGEPQLSPDGGAVAFVRQYFDLKENSVRSEIWTVSTPGGEPRQMTAGDKRDANPRWSPDGSKLAFTSDRSGKNQLYVIEHGPGEARLIATNEEPASAPVWSPDGKRLAFMASVFMNPETPYYCGAPVTPIVLWPDEKDPDPVKIIKAMRHKQEPVGFFGNKFNHVFVVPAEPTTPGQKAATSRVTDGRFNHDMLDWSPDGKYLVFVANREVPDDDPVWIRHLWLYEFSSGRIIRVLREEHPVRTPAFSPDGRMLAFIGADYPFNWSSSPHDLFVMDFEPEKFPVSWSSARNLTASIDRSIGGSAGSEVRYMGSSNPICWSTDCREVWITVGMEGQGHLWRIPVDGRQKPEQATQGTRVVASLTAAKTGRLAYMDGGPTKPDEVFTMTPDGTESQLTRLNEPVAREMRLVEPERICYKGPDGWDIEGWVMKPVDYEPGKRYPTILWIHGGPNGMYGYGFSFSFQYAVNAGFAVVYVNPRGSVGYGGKFSLAVLEDWGKKDFLDITAGLDKAISMGMVDPDRLGVTGGSYGGFMTCWTITQTNRFKAAVAAASITDQCSMYGTSDIGYGFTETSTGGQPWENLAPLTEHSPLSHSPNVTTPLLLLHGEKDLRCPIGQSEEYFTALQRQGKTAVFVRYPGEGHQFRKPRNQIDKLERTLAWLDYYIRGNRK